MLADFFTKPLQGHLFRRFRDVILGYSHVNTLRRDTAVPPEERVGKGGSGARDVTPANREPGEKSVNGKKDTGKVTWADVVRGRVANTEEENPRNEKNVLRSLSRNNPVSFRTEV